MDGEERTPVLLLAEQGLSEPESSSAQLPTLDELQAKHRELEATRAEHRRVLQSAAEAGFGAALAAEPDSASVNTAAQGSVPGPDSCVEAQASAWQSIPSETLRTGFARLKSAAGKALVSDGSGPPGREGSRVLKPQFRTLWEKLWRFFALSMDSADEQSGYLDRFRFEDLLKKRAQISDRAVIKKLWAIAIAAGDGVQSGDAAAKLRYSQQEEDSPEGFLEFVEAWGEQSKSRVGPEFEARRSSRGSSGGGPAAIVASGSTGELLSSDWADLARQRAIALPPAELAQVRSTKLTLAFSHSFYILITYRVVGARRFPCRYYSVIRRKSSCVVSDVCARPLQNAATARRSGSRSSPSLTPTTRTDWS